MKNIRFALTIIIGIALFSSPIIWAHADGNQPIFSGATTTVVHTTASNGTTVTFDVTAVSGDASSTPLPANCVPSSGSLFSVGTATVNCTAVDAINNATGTTSFEVGVILDETAHIGIRVANTLVGPFDITLPSADATTSIAATGTTTTHDISGRSVLALLSDAAASSSSFSISNLQYYDSMGFYVKCLTVPSATSSPLCDNWRYSLDSTFPSVAADVETVSNNDTAYFFYGSPRQVVISTSTVTVGTPVTVSAKVYDPATNTYASTTGVTVGAVQFDPNNPYNPPTVFATSTVDASGVATFTLNATGTYQVGIAEDYYSPSGTLTVTDATTNSNTGSSGSNAGGGGGGFSHSNLDTARAFSFLNSHQNTDGSMGSSIMYTDWAAIAYATADPTSATQKAKLHDYLVSASPTLSSVTDYERHAMALEALNINPYSSAGKDYITPIVNAFDGTQIGSTSQINDDIFALYALTHAGYTSSDTIIQKTTAYLLSQQQTDGSWSEDPEMTAAAAQALGPLYDLPGVNAKLGMAIYYLMGAIKPTGGWGNADATSWVQTAFNSMNEAPAPSPHFAQSDLVASNGYYPLDVIAKAQQPDGSVVSINTDVDSKIWSTSYALVAVSNKSWVSLLSYFSKPGVQVIGGGYYGSSGGTSTATSTIAATSTDSTFGSASSTTTTSTAATSTLPEATSTPTGVLVISSNPFATSTASTTPPTHPKKKIVHSKSHVPTPKTTPNGRSLSENTAQTAAAATVVNHGFFGAIWNFIKHIFTGR